MLIGIALLIGLLFLFACYTSLFYQFKPKIYDLENVPYSPAILVLGAGLDSPNTPSDILTDRLISAANLIRRSRPVKVVLSGARSKYGGGETDVMSSYLQKRGIQIERISIDKNGWSTFHSLLHVKSRIDASECLTIISQRFHLTRALLIGKLLGIACIGLAADNLKFSRAKTAYWYLREIIAVPFNIMKFLKYKISCFYDKS